MTEEQEALALYRMERAKEALEEARVLLDTGHGNASVNRLYYACFYAVSGLLLTEGRASSKHSGVRSLFMQHWVKPGRVSVPLARLYRRLFESRQQGDYADFVSFSPATVEPWLDEAEGFVTKIGEVIDEML